MTIYRNGLFMLLAAALFAPLPGCTSSYVVPRGASAPLAEITGQDSAQAAMQTNQPLTYGSIDERLSRQPTVTFPVGIAVVRLQANGYRSNTTQTYGQGAYSIVTTRDVETDDQIKRINNLPLVAGAAPVSRLLIRSELHDDLPLRQAAASMKAQMLLMYTFDTNYFIEDMAKPLSVVTLGLSPNQQARVVSTVSALLIDTRTGYIYGAAESTEKVNQLASAWTNQEAVDQAQRRAEAKAFEGLVQELERLWPNLIETYAPNAAMAPR